MQEAVATLVPDKDQIRRRIWETLQAEGVARFPGIWGRIPNFAGAAAAADQLRRLDAWQAARVIKCNPDAPQLPVRRAALREGKVVYMAVPRLRQAECFLELDPLVLGDSAARAASIAGAFRYGRPLAPEQVRPVDLVVCGSVAAAENGSRLGKGGGYSDLEFGLLMEFAKVGPDTPIATTIHPLQLSTAPLPMRAHDVPLDYIAMPEALVGCRTLFARPQGIFWDILPRERIEAIPPLRRLWREAGAGPVR